MAGGVPPTPSAILRLRGSWRAKARKKGGEPEVAPVALVCPEHVQGEARALWERLAPLLASAGITGEADGPAFEALCTTYARWRTADRELAEEGLLQSRTTAGGDAYQQAHPLVAVSLAYMAEFRAQCDRFGVSPSMRSRVTARPPEGATGDAVPAAAPARAAGGA